MNPMSMTESDFGLEAGRMPFFSEELVSDVSGWLERNLTDDERERLKVLCPDRPGYCSQKAVSSCRECSLVNYGRDCQNNQVNP